MFNKTKGPLIVDKYNRKKTKANDLIRFNNIHKNKINIIPMQKLDKSVVYKSVVDKSVVDETVLENKTDNIYNFGNVQTSAVVNLLKDTYDPTKDIPKIEMKESVFANYLPVDDYDFNINKNINLNVEMDIYFSEKFYDVDVGVLRRKKVHHINNVYQELYKDKIKPTGFGDFIRGCYFLLQFCEKHGFLPHFIINHPLAEFLKQFDTNYLLHKEIHQIALSGIPMFVNNNWKESVFDSHNYIIDVVKSKQTNNEFINYLCNLSVQKHHIFIYNNMFPYDAISSDHKMFIRKMLEPNGEMEQYLMDNLELLQFTRGNYVVIHIRSGDTYLTETNKIFETSYFKKLLVEIILIINKYNDASFLLIADNNEIKYLLLENFPNLKAVFKDITHLGEGTVLERQKVKNTMLDFYLLANSAAIHSFSAYPHGSGFSLWCARTYDIPYSCKYIKPSPI